MRGHRCPDVWALDGYLDEAGWDGQHEVIYFSRKQDAEAYGERLAEHFADFNDGTGYQYEVYQIFSHGSFYDPDPERTKEQRDKAIDALIEIYEEVNRGDRV